MGAANDPVGSAWIGNHAGIERQERRVAREGLSIERIQMDPTGMKWEMSHGITAARSVIQAGRIVWAKLLLIYHSYLYGGT